MRYSDSTGCFYPDELHYTTLPDDLIKVDDDFARKAINRPAGATLQVVKGVLTIVLPTDDEVLEMARTQQAAVLRAACAQAITAGFESSALGQPHTYPGTLTDQSNMTAAAIVAGTSGSDWSASLWCADADGTWKLVAHTAKQLTQVHADWHAALQSNQTRYAKLQAQLQAAQTPDDVAAVTW